MEDFRQAWKTKLQENLADLLDWCLARKQDTLLNIQAFLNAQTINAVDAGDGYNKAAVEYGDVIGHELGIDMTDHFKPTAED